MKVLWFSSHFPDYEQVKELEKIFGEKIHIIQYHEKMKLGGGSKIQKMMAIHHCDELVIYKMPNFLLGEIMEYGIKPIMADVTVQKNETGIKEISFNGFYRITEMTSKKEEIKKVKVA